jgi:hypothetical protein
MPLSYESRNRFERYIAGPILFLASRPRRLQLQFPSGSQRVAVRKVYLFAVMPHEWSHSVGLETVTNESGLGGSILGKRWRMSPTVAWGEDA